MKENELIELGFKKEYCIDEIDGNNFHYYTYDLGNGNVSLITESSDEVKDGIWHVQIFEDSSIEFVSKIELQQVIRIIERNTKTK